MSDLQMPYVLRYPGRHGWPDPTRKCNIKIEWGTQVISPYLDSVKFWDEILGCQKCNCIDVAQSIIALASTLFSCIITPAELAELVKGGASIFLINWQGQFQDREPTSASHILRKTTWWIGWAASGNDDYTLANKSPSLQVLPTYQTDVTEEETDNSEPL